MSPHDLASSSVTVPAAQIAARVRAALAYAGLRYEDIAAKSDDQMTAAKLRRIASASAPRGAELVELWQIADACEVPRGWLEHGRWDDSQGRARTSIPRFGDGSIPDRVEVLERYVTALLGFLAKRDADEDLRRLPPIADAGDEIPLPFDDGDQPRREASRANGPAA